ncbi:MAG: RidA family protein [Rhodospirillales bacterium]|nr:RidA family protein [Acetobacter sp.]
MSTRKVIFPAHPHALYKRDGYSPAILSGDFLFCSGMNGARLDGTPEPELQAEVQLAFDNLQGVLAAAGCTFDDVVDLTVFLMDASASIGLVVEAIKKAFAGVPPSNVTAVGVTWMSGFRVELKAIARIPHPAASPGDGQEA